MKLLEQIKTRIGTGMLHATIKKTKAKKFIPFEQVQEIGIVYDAESNQDELKILNYASHLRQQGKKVQLLGFINQKKVPHTKKIHISSEFFSREKLNAFNLPEVSKIGRFVDTPFDVLLGIFRTNTLPLNAVSVYSKARYKIGGNATHGIRYFDTIIDTGTDTDIEHLAYQMEHYMKVIK